MGQLGVIGANFKRLIGATKVQNGKVRIKMEQKRL